MSRGIIVQVQLSLLVQGTFVRGQKEHEKNGKWIPAESDRIDNLKVLLHSGNVEGKDLDITEHLQPNELNDILYETQKDILGYETIEGEDMDIL